MSSYSFWCHITAFHTTTVYFCDCLYACFLICQLFSPLWTVCSCFMKKIKDYQQSCYENPVSGTFIILLKDKIDSYFLLLFFQLILECIQRLPASLLSKQSRPPERKSPVYFKFYNSIFIQLQPFQDMRRTLIGLTQGPGGG